MNIKNIIAALATTITVATTSVAMADVRFSGSAQVGANVGVGGSVVIRDHRTEQPAYTVPAYPAQTVRPIYVTQPVNDVALRDHREHRWEPAPQPVVVHEPPAPVISQEPVITCESNRFTVLATDHLDGSETAMSNELYNFRNVRGIDQLQFKWVYGNTSIKDVVVNYANGISKTYYLGDSLTANKNNQVTRVVDVDNTPIRSIQIIGWSWQPQAQFQILGKA